MLKYVLFDLDGTLSDTSEGILNGFMYMLEKLGLPLPADKQELRPMLGPPIPRSLVERYGTSREVAEEGLRLYRVYYGPIGTRECCVFPGIPELLGTLHARGIKVVTATSKAEPFARSVLEHLGIAEYIDFFGCADMGMLRREKEDVLAYVMEQLPDLRPENAIMVGDREFDVIGARTVGLRCIACTYGYASPGELEAQKPDYTVDTVAQLQKLLISLAGQI